MFVRVTLYYFGCMFVASSLNHFWFLILIIRSSNWTGKFFFISFINKAWWFTLSKALLISIAQRLTVLPFVTYPSTILRNACIAFLQPKPYLNPNWLSDDVNNDWYLSKKQYSKTFDKTGLMAIPRKSSQVNALERKSLIFGMGTIFESTKYITCYHNNSEQFR